MMLFLLGLLIGGITGLFLMSLMVAAKRADEINEGKRSIHFQHP